MVHGIDHHGDVRERIRLGDHPRQGGTVEAGIADDDIADAAGVEEQCLGDGIREHTGIGGMGERPVDGGGHAQGLRGQPDRQSASAFGQGVEVGVEGVEIEDGGGCTGSFQRTPETTRHHIG